MDTNKYQVRLHTDGKKAEIMEESMRGVHSPFEVISDGTVDGVLSLKVVMDKELARDIVAGLKLLDLAKAQHAIVSARDHDLSGFKPRDA